MQALFLVLLLASTSSGQTFDAAVSAEEDAALLLQSRGRTAADQKPRKKAMAFQGGGFKAHAAQTGVIGALLSASAKDGGASTLQQLLSDVKVLSSVSGGSWFLSQLIFSPTFQTTVESIANHPTQSGDFYWRSWLWPWISSLNPFYQHKAVAAKGSSPLTAAQHTVPVAYRNNDRVAVNSSLSTSFLDIIEVLWELYFFTDQQRSWEDVVAQILRSTTGDMSGHETLGSPVNAWAEDKQWLIGTSLSTPGGNGPATCHDLLELCFYEIAGMGMSTLIFGNGTDSTWTYSASASSESPLASWTPARFSTVLGTNGPAPMKYCEVCDDLVFEYKRQGQSAQSPNQRNFPTFNSSKVPLISAVTASSAFLGVLIVAKDWDAQFQGKIASAVSTFLSSIGVSSDFAEWLRGGLDHLFEIDWARWAASADHGASVFDKASALLQELQDKDQQRVTVETLAQQGLFAMVDGGLTDATAIGHALASGMEEIVCIQDGLDNLFQLMGKVPSGQNIINIPLTTTCPFCYAHFQLFQESIKDAKEQWQSVSQPLMLMHSVSALNSVDVGSLSLTTAENHYFGIPSGRTVKLRVVNVNSSLFIGGFAYQDYADLVQDVVDVLLYPQNQNVTEMILDWLRPH